MLMKTRHDIATVTSHAAILDIAFSPHVLTLFVACTSTGTLDFYELDTERGNIVLSQSVQAFDSSLLILDVVFHPSRADCLGVTLSDGRVCLVRLPTTIAKGFRESIRPVNPIELSKEHVVEVSRHELEAWTLEVGHDGQTIFSGGDDCQFRCASIPMSDEHAKSTTRWSDRKLHGAGVTAILPLQSPSGRAKPQETFVLTGSYDDHVRLIKLPDMQIVKRAQVLAEENLGGGVWRLALMDSSTQSEDSQTKDTYHVLASCMHAGVRILEIKHMTGSNHEISDSHDASQDEWSIRIAASFTEHKSMNYASAVRPISMPAQQKGETRTYTVVSTSFYDRLLCVWRCTI